jgi:protein gp37
VEAAVPFFFKQWGEFSPEAPWVGCARKIDRCFEDGTRMYRVGKARAGRMLDGEEWNQYPEEIQA